MMSFWPIDPEPLGPDEVEVTREQFAALAILAERHQATGESQDEAMLAVCPRLHRYRTNKLVVRQTRRWGCCW